MPFGEEKKLLKKIDRFATQLGRGGRPSHEPLVANIATFKLAALSQLWQEDSEFPAEEEERWWEVWFADVQGEGRLAEAVEHLGLRMGERTLRIADRTIAMIRATPMGLSGLLSTNCVVAELRRPPRPHEFIEPGTRRLEEELIHDLAQRIRPADAESPAVCLLDSGINEHPLLRASLDQAETALEGGTPADLHGRGHRPT